MKNSHFRPKQHYRHMTFEMAEEIRRKYFSRQATQQALAVEYGTHKSSINRIVCGVSFPPR